jgi:hypothetical protein
MSSALQKSPFGCYFEPAFDAASRITLATFTGCASIITWLEETVVVVAPIFLACAASSSGEIARSFAPMNQSLS